VIIIVVPLCCRKVPSQEEEYINLSSELYKFWINVGEYGMEGFIF
jgi:hypothetical protein